MKKGMFAVLRRQVRDIQAATKAGTTDFEALAKMHGSEIYTCRYHELQDLWCDTLAVINGKVVITEQNLQYFPAKIRYFYTISNNK